jgi:hypothetical protein
MDTALYPFPGTRIAREYGCICPHPKLGDGTLEQRYALDVRCPLHGIVAIEEHLKGPRH